MPTCLLVRACIQVWADKKAESPHFSTWRRYRNGREAWVKASGIDDRESFRLLPDGGAPWSVDFLVETGRGDQADGYLAVAGCTRTDVPALRSQADALLGRNLSAPSA